LGRINREKFKVYEGVFDNQTLDSLNFLREKNYFDSIIRPIKTGKEGDAYLVKKEEGFRVIKIFRLTSANFKKIQHYINRDFRFRNVRGSLRKTILAWCLKEYKNLILCHKAGMNVPFPFKQTNNIIVMEYIDGPMLKDIEIEDPKTFFKELIEQLQIMKNKAKLVHGDLSEYNILVKDQSPVIIDLGQSMNIRNQADFTAFYDLYERDVNNIVNYFNKKYNLNLELKKVFKDLDNSQNL
jgi:RIO kinase 1